MTRMPKTARPATGTRRTNATGPWCETTEADLEDGLDCAVVPPAHGGPEPQARVAL